MWGGGQVTVKKQKQKTQVFVIFKVECVTDRTILVNEIDYQL